MRNQLPKKLRTALLAAAAVCTIACTPTLDWRTTPLSSHGDRYTVTFPGKALSAQKSVTLSGAAHTLTLHAVQADTAQFALGNVPAKDAAQAQDLARALAQAFASNMGGELKQTPVAVAKALGAFDVSYPTQANRYAQARFVWTATAAYELLTVGKPSDLTPETADTFIRSIRFE
jgi:hypothetical protein